MSIDPKILEDLKRIVILTGQLSSVHEKTLKTSPFVFFDGVKEVSLSYDLKTDGSSGMPGLGSKIAFTIDFESDPKEDPLFPKRLEALRKTVSHLLWKEVDMSVSDKKGNRLDV